VAFGHGWAKRRVRNRGRCIRRCRVLDLWAVRFGFACPGACNRPRLERGAPTGALLQPRPEQRPTLKLGQPLELTRPNRDTSTANRTTRRHRPEPEERQNQTQRNQPPAKHRTKLDRRPSRTPKLPRRNCPRVIPRHQPELETQTPGPDMLMPQPSHPPENKMLSHALIFETAFYFQVGGGRTRVEVEHGETVTADSKPLTLSQPEAKWQAHSRCCSRRASPLG